MIIPPLVYGFILVQLLVVSYYDLKFRKIYNYWPLLNIIILVPLFIFFPKHYNVIFDYFVFPFSFLIVGFILFFYKIMGAGDVKFLFTLFLIIPEKVHIEFFLLLSYSTILIGLFIMFFKGIKKWPHFRYALIIRDFGLIKKIFHGKLPYSPVIFMGWILLGVIHWKRIFL